VIQTGRWIDLIVFASLEMALKTVISFALVAAISAAALPQHGEYNAGESAPIVEDYTEQTPTRQPYISAFRDDQQQANGHQLQQPQQQQYQPQQQQPQQQQYQPSQQQQQQVQQPIEYTYFDAQPQPEAVGHVLQQREVQFVHPTHTQVVYPKQEVTSQGTYYQEKQEEHFGPAEYDFAYSVHDEKTGDIKQQKESRHGDAVVGEYSLVEPDGHLRTVKYSSDKHTGFVAEVSRTEVKGYEAPVQQKASYY
jgi:Insect cuticle protein